MNRLLVRRIVPLAAGLVAIVLFSALGMWQLERAQDKRATQQRLAADRDPVRRLPQDASKLASLAYRRVALRGRFLPERQFLLDNRTFEGAPGFDVLTPLELPDGRTVLVDRGWVPMGPQREPREQVTVGARGPVEVRGRIWRPDAAIGLGAVQASRAGWPRVVTRIEYPVLRQALGRDLVPVVIRAKGEADWLYQYRPLEPTFGPQRHYGYAFQWFALAITVAVIAGGLLLRRYRRASHD